MAIAPIVVVDDCRENATLLCRLLRQWGYESVPLLSVGELFGYLNHGTAPSLVIMDLMMPEVDGLQGLRAMRQNPQWRDIPVVMYSADNNPERRRDARRLGVKDYMIKGAVMVDELLSSIQRNALPSS